MFKSFGCLIRPPTRTAHTDNKWPPNATFKRHTNAIQIEMMINSQVVLLCRRCFALQCWAELWGQIWTDFSKFARICPPKMNSSEIFQRPDFFPFPKDCLGRPTKLVLILVHFQEGSRTPMNWLPVPSQKHPFG